MIAVDFNPVVRRKAAYQLPAALRTIGQKKKHRRNQGRWCLGDTNSITRQYLLAEVEIMRVFWPTVLNAAVICYSRSVLGLNE